MLVADNDRGTFSTVSRVPLLMIQCENDDPIPVSTTALLARHLCVLGQTLRRWVYPGKSYGSVIGPSMSDMIHRFTDRFANQVVPDPYAPVGMPGL
jgi:hypothetical protein